ncbi:hypothetical protein [Pontibacter saemangeumensis]
MKAELMMKGICVHKLNGGIPAFTRLAKEQFRRPIRLDEIDKIQPFQIEEEFKVIQHQAIRETTLGYSELTKSFNYLNHYEIDSSKLEFISQINKTRNRLHFNNSIDFELTEEFISNIKAVNQFADDMINKFLNWYSNK